MMSIGTHTMAHAMLVVHRNIQSAVIVILGPYHLISALQWCHCSSRDFVGQQNAVQLTLENSY